MFRLLAGLFRRTNPAAGRQIFSYHDGTRDRTADPIEVWDRLKRALGEDPEAVVRLLATNPPPAPPDLTEAVRDQVREYRAKQEEAARRFAAAVSEAFGVPAYSDEGGTPAGLTVPERVGLGCRFLSYLGGLGRSARPFSSSPPPTGASPPG